MLNDITLGQYFPGDSAIHRMDPAHAAHPDDSVYRRRVLRGQPAGLCHRATVFVYSGCAFSGIKFSYLLKGIKPLRFIIIFTFVLNLFFVQGKTAAVYARLFHPERGEPCITRFTSRSDWCSWSWVRPC